MPPTPNNKSQKILLFFYRYLWENRHFFQVSDLTRTNCTTISEGLPLKNISLYPLTTTMYTPIYQEVPYPPWVYSRTGNTLYGLSERMWKGTSDKGYRSREERFTSLIISILLRDKVRDYHTLSIVDGPNQRVPRASYACELLIGNRLTICSIFILVVSMLLPDANRNAPCPVVRQGNFLFRMWEWLREGLSCSHRIQRDPCSNSGPCRQSPAVSNYKVVSLLPECGTG